MSNRLLRSPTSIVAAPIAGGPPGLPQAEVAASAGAFLLLYADMVAQQILAQPIPVGMVTVILGGLYLVALLLGGPGTH